MLGGGDDDGACGAGRAGHESLSIKSVDNEGVYGQGERMDR